MTDADDTTVREQSVTLALGRALHERNEARSELDRLADYLIAIGATIDAREAPVGAAISILSAYAETGPWPGRPVPVKEATSPNLMPQPIVRFGWPSDPDIQQRIIELGVNADGTPILRHWNDGRIDLAGWFDIGGIVLSDPPEES